MARAYKKTYLNGAMRNLAVMMDCGVRKYGYLIEEFYDKFLSSEVSRQFANGNNRNVHIARQLPQFFRNRRRRCLIVTASADIADFQQIVDINNVDILNLFQPCHLIAQLVNLELWGAIDKYLVFKPMLVIFIAEKGADVP